MPSSLWPASIRSVQPRLRQPRLRPKLRRCQVVRPDLSVRQPKRRPLPHPNKASRSRPAGMQHPWCPTRTTFLFKAPQRLASSCSSVARIIICPNSRSRAARSRRSSGQRPPSICCSNQLRSRSNCWRSSWISDDGDWDWDTETESQMSSHPGRQPVTMATTQWHR